MQIMNRRDVTEPILFNSIEVFVQAVVELRFEVMFNFNSRVNILL